jgi:orotidine-5'-phosphate decarboxylase
VTPFDKLRAAWATTDSMLCVGLDPDEQRLPVALADRPDRLLTFCRDIVDATADVVCAFKPQIAHFAAAYGEGVLEAVCAHIRSAAPHALLVLDAKRGDIGSTAERYASEAFARYGADMVTVSPYLGGDSIKPFLQSANHGVFALCRTSNPGSGDFQSLLVDGEPLYLHVARRAANEWSQWGSCGLVVGATYPAELAAVRRLVGDLPLLVPGVGAQGGDIAATVAAGASSDGYGMVVNSSRAVLYASAGDDYAQAARREAIATRDALRHAQRRRQTG